jgi:tRNA-specific 2-thiouridylase
MGERVVIAMSGGVDSSVAAALLVEQGYDVVGVMLRLWAEPALPPRARLDTVSFPALGPGGPEPAATYSALSCAQSARRARELEDFGAANRCCSIESINDARAVADRLGIPFYVINVERLFKEAVVDAFIQAYGAGLTPNPCLACNRLIRFGYLLAYARSLIYSALSCGACHLATGHYARVRRGPGEGYQLLRGVDRLKDQSYVISVLGQEQLAQVLFPLGEYSKTQVRELAAARSLPTASKAESQDLCFVADGDYRRFLADWAPEIVRPGPILDRAGRQLGTHHGLPFYTIGQRSGLGIAAPQPLYVLALDRVRNAVVVGAADEPGQMTMLTGQVNWVAGSAPKGSLVAEVQIRYRARPAPARITPLADGGAEVRFERPRRDIAPGQAAVFYDGDLCLGSGIIVQAAGSGVM